MRSLKVYQPRHGENRMKHEGDLASAREEILSEVNKNLNFLLRTRYEWMRNFIDPRMKGLEIGAGAGAGKKYLADYSFLLSDIGTNDWLDVKEVDAHNLPFENGQFDYLILNNVFHHLAFPSKFFDEAHRVLKTNGTVLIIDPYSSLMMKVILRLMRHEGFNDYANPFDESRPCNDPLDPWSANCSLARLLLHNGENGLKRKGFQVEYTKIVEFVTFLNSGGGHRQILSLATYLSFSKASRET